MLIFVVDGVAILMFLIAAFCFAGAAAVLVSICEFLIAHLTATIIGVVIISLIVGAIKTVLVCAEDDTWWGLPFVASFLSVGIVIMFAFMYIIPLWIYYGGFYSLIETIGAVILFTFVSALVTCVVNFLLSLIYFPEGAALAVSDCVAKIACVAGLYFLGLDGIHCYLFDYLGVMAPFV